jgi:restriction system protein
MQELVADLLRALGYHVEWVAPPGKDAGVDIIALTDPLGTRAPRIKVQVKSGQQRIDLEKLNAFLAVVDVGDIGLYVSVGGFTKDAEEAARKQTSRKVTLINAERPVDLWMKVYDKLIPAVLIALISLGYLEEDGVLLSISLLAAVVVLALDLGLVWEVLHGAKPITPRRCVAAATGFCLLMTRD